MRRATSADFRPEMAEDDCLIDLLTSLPGNGWKLRGAISIQEAVTHTVQACPKRKTCVSSGVVSEIWQTYLDTDERATAHWAWASTDRMMSGGPKSQSIG